MAEGLSAYLSNSWLDALGNNTSFVVAQVYVKLHVGAPGALGTAFPAIETTRKAVSFGAASSGVLTSNDAITWTNIAGSQDANHFTCWDSLTAGNFLFSGNLTSNPYDAGDTFEIASGNLTATLTVAS
jgi:hypothetical protein